LVIGYWLLVIGYWLLVIDFDTIIKINKDYGSNHPEKGDSE